MVTGKEKLENDGVNELVYYYQEGTYGIMVNVAGNGIGDPGSKTYKSISSPHS